MNSRKYRRLRGVVYSLLYFLGTAAMLAGALITLLGIVKPWAQAVLFGGLHISIPGLFFSLGGLCGAASIVVLIFRRIPLLCLAAGFAVIIFSTNAGQTIPHTVRGELISAQLSFAPINQLLDQFHIETVMVSNYGAKDEMYIGEGIGLVGQGGQLIVLGSVVALLGDPAVRSVRRRLQRERCVSCATSWPVSREALYCPNCATPTKQANYFCRACQTPLEPADSYCVQCGTEALPRTASG